MKLFFEEPGSRKHIDSCVQYRLFSEAIFGTERIILVTSAVMC